MTERNTSTFMLDYVEPPKARRGRTSEVNTILEKVAADANGKWAMIATSPSKTGANGIVASIRTPDRVLPAPVEFFDFTTRVDAEAGTSTLWVRWLGEEGAQAKAAEKAEKAAAKAAAGAPQKRGPGRPRKGE